MIVDRQLRALLSTALDILSMKYQPESHWKHYTVITSRILVHKNWVCFVFIQRKYFVRVLYLYYACSC